MNATEARAPGEERSSKALHLWLWVAQGLLAAAFLAVGGSKLTLSVDQLAVRMHWVRGAMGPLLRFIGLAELSGALGMILPAATRIRPGLTPLAARGLTMLMVLGALTHLVRDELPLVALNATLGGLAAFVAWGRSSRAVIAPRSRA